ncbi:hypothetical protein Tco_0973643 [Tanacetum coccineum]
MMLPCSKAQGHSRGSWYTLSSGSMSTRNTFRVNLWNDILRFLCYNSKACFSLTCENVLQDSCSDLDSFDDDYDPLDDLTNLVDFQTEGDDNLDIPKIITDDPWLNKLVGKGNFIGYIENPKPLDGRFILEEDDPDEHLVYQKFKLKNCLANYGVNNGYQLWYMQNDSSKLLVKCGRDVSKGKCERMKGKKPNPKPSVEEPKVGESSKKGEKGVYSEKAYKGESNKISKNGKSSEKIKEKWTKQKIIEANRLKGQVDCPFRLWASWMSTERSF